MLKRYFFGDGRQRLYNASLGCELAVDSNSGEAVVARIEHGTPAHWCGRLAEGDRVISINGEQVATCAAELWQAVWMDEEVGSPVWLKVAPCNGAGTLSVCLLRCGEDSSGKRTPLSTENKREGCVGIELDQGVTTVAHLEEGGAAWLALLAPAILPAPILPQDKIVMIEGETVASASRAKAMLSGRAFSRVHLSVIRKGTPQRVTLVRSPRLQGHEMDAAVEYRMESSRTPALPPSLRHGRRNIAGSEVEPPLIGATSCIREAAAHSLMAQSPKMLLIGSEEASAHITEVSLKPKCMIIPYKPRFA